MNDKLPDVYSTHSAARFCRVTPMTIIRWIDEGRIRAYKTPGGHRRIMRSDLEEFCRRAGIPMEWEDRVETVARRVLVVDDDANVVDRILDALLDEREGEQSSFEVEHADNAFDGGRLLSAFRPDVIFVGLHLPGTRAADVARSIRSDPATANVRIVGITSRDGEERPSRDFDAVIGRNPGAVDIRRVTGPLPRIPTR